LIRCGLNNLLTWECDHGSVLGVARRKRILGRRHSI
jgi:hypothetical protein